MAAHFNNATRPSSELLAFRKCRQAAFARRDVLACVFKQILRPRSFSSRYAGGTDQAMTSLRPLMPSLATTSSYFGLRQEKNNELAGTTSLRTPGDSCGTVPMTQHCMHCMLKESHNVHADGHNGKHALTGRRV